MSSSAYYNENDPGAAQWLRELIREGLIAPGEVDDRSIKDVAPVDLRGFTQCHFFAGIGIWSYALRQAGWDDDRPVWTGSCPCQPFSTSGAKKGFADERHLWPDWFWIIQQCCPDTVIGEQVAGAGTREWIDLVGNDLEGIGFRFGACVTSACGFGAPHIRRRMYWLADSSESRQSGESRESRPQDCGTAECGGTGRLADSQEDKQRSGRRPGGKEKEGNEPGIGASGCREIMHPKETNGHWRDADRIFCRDNKWRFVEPGTFPLVDGYPERVGLLRGYGNALCAPQATGFIKSYLNCDAR